ncbi:PAS domain S-box-containing protein [Salegentibacter sp. 24]|uniref:sensor histidine kinase n=1 Tax=Salegentibacter sp. 24 TaxID=2183986 RepID=UPI00105C1B0C|nr:PAS domain-containing sensor histidine kinase [Salegentibacter sp. 24]TDN85235.1 PAS domain S-box-containing protein [Salegentibacter sp. 24]
MQEDKIDFTTWPSNDQGFLLLADLENSKIEYINNIAASYCGVERSVFNNLCFYKEFLHPDDYPGYIAHLKSMKELLPEQEIMSFARLKGKCGKFKKFRFKDRLYRGFTDKKRQIVLSVINEVDSENKNKIKNTENTILKNKATESEYQQLLYSMDEAFFIAEIIYDSEKNPIDIYFEKTNPAFEKQINLKNVPGRTIREIFNSPRLEWLKTFGEVVKSGKPIRFQDTSANLNDSWLDFYVFKLGDLNSRRIGVLFRNITDQKIEEKILEQKAIKRQEDLEESNELLQSVFESTNLAIVVFQSLFNDNGEVHDFKFLRINKVLRALYMDQDPVGKTYLEVSKYGVEMGMYDALKEVVKSGEPMDKELYFDKDSYNHWFRLTARKHGKLLIATLEDITERKIKDEQLKETIRFKQQLVRTSPETIIIFNLSQFNVRYINKDIFKKGGLTREKVQGMSLEKLLPFIHPRDRETVMNMHRKLLKSSDDDIHDIEIRLKLQRTSWEWFNVRGKVFHRKDESWVEEYVLLVRNIHNFKNTKKALLKAEKLSIQGELARTFAHELRNPLASIGMVAEVIGAKLAGEKDNYNTYLEILTRSTKTLNNLVNNLLNSANYTPAVLKKQNLAEILDETINMASDRIYLSGIKVIKNYKGPYSILADSAKLKIALLNIIVNASEATVPEEGIITVEVRKHKTDFQLSITDNGHGLQQEEIDRLFEAFYSKKETGMGVGLSSVKNILEEHDAPIRVESKPKEGTTFNIYFQNVALL